MTRQAADHPAPTPTNSDRVLGEAWLARRLGKHGVVVVFEGVMTADEHKERLREVIRERGLETVICARNPTTGKPDRYAQVFERLYGEPL